ncbi:MAG: lipocalin family protein [Alcaligenaceae bacterium]|nr:lipocalin family protein [Alcaligenaceae bacterium]
MRLLATKQESQLLTHPNLDLRRYAGLWYEYARLPNNYQLDCTGEVTADYTWHEDNTLAVHFSCSNSECQILDARAEARPVQRDHPIDPAKLEIRFSSDWLSAPSSVWRDHWVLYVDPGYLHAMIGTPDRRCLWMLGRSRTPDRAALQQMLRYAAQLGFSVNRVLRTGETG